MKIIFLDIDGVLNNVRTYPQFDEACVQRVNDISNKTQAAICLISTRRNWSDTKPMLAEAGLTTPIVGITPDLGYESSRSDEIHAWMSRNPVESFVIIDDDTHFDKELAQHLIKTSSTEGLQDSHVQMAITILQKQI